MRKLILLLVFPLLGMPAFAQQKKKPAGRKKKAAKTAVVQKKINEPQEPEPVVISVNGTGSRPEDAPSSAANKIFTSVEQMPEFPGGLKAMMQFMGANTQYPAVAKAEGIQGRVLVRFVVSSTGQVTQAEIFRDIGGGCGKEAIRVVNSMPLWKPGRQNGQPVSVYYTLPFVFRLQEDIPTEKKEQ